MTDKANNRPPLAKSSIRLTGFGGKIDAPPHSVRDAIEKFVDEQFDLGKLSPAEIPYKDMIVDNLLGRCGDSFESDTPNQKQIQLRGAVAEIFAKGAPPMPAPSTPGQD